MAEREAVHGEAMSRTAPSVGAAVAPAASLLAMRLRAGRKWKVALAAVLMVVATALGSLVQDGQDRAALFAEVLDRGLLTLLAPLLGFLFGAGLFAEELEEGTFVFQALRPAPRAALVLGRFLAAAAAALALWTAAVLALHVAVFAASPGEFVARFPATLRALGGGALLLGWLLAVSALLGTLLPEAAGVAAGLYLLLVETAGTWLPGVLRLAVLSHHGRMLAGAAPRNLFAGIEEVGERMLPPAVHWGVSASALLLATLAALALTTVVVVYTEIRPSRP